MRRNVNQRNGSQALCQCPRCQARRQAQRSCACQQRTTSYESDNRLRPVDTMCGSYTRPVSDLPYATSYVRPQSYQNIYEPQQGLARGTIFADLDQPMCCE